MRIPFHASERASLGVEMELSLVERTTRELSSAATAVLDELGRHHERREHPRAKHELFECTLEVITGVCDTVDEAAADLEETIAEVRREVEPRGLGLLCAGTHPFSHWRDQKVSPNQRYADLVESIQWPARRLAIYGSHFHVGVRSAEKSIAIANALTYYLPHLLALSASSPYWHGLDTGMASCRTKVFEALPTAGLPPRLDSWSDFEAFMGALVHADAIRTIREVWWDIRPHPDFGTVELRMCDAVPTVGETAALAALAQCLVSDLDDRHERGEPLPAPREWVVRQNKWLAARHGLDVAILVDDRGSRRPLPDEITDLLDRLAPVAARLGCSDRLAAVRPIVERGPGYRRQRRVVDEGGTLHDVVDVLLHELATDAPQVHA